MSEPAAAILLGERVQGRSDPPQQWVLGQVGRAFPEYGAVRGGYVDVAEAPVGVPAFESDVAILAELVVDGEE